MICRDHEQGIDGFADVDAWWSSDSFDLIKPRVIGALLAQQPTCYFSLTSFILTMSLVNSHVFERSMGHQISREDARFHMHTSDGQHYLSNQQVRSCTDLALASLTVVLIVGGPCDDV